MAAAPSRRRECDPSELFDRSLEVAWMPLLFPELVPIEERFDCPRFREGLTAPVYLLLSPELVAVPVPWDSKPLEEALGSGTLTKAAVQRETPQSIASWSTRGVDDNVSVPAPLLTGAICGGTAAS